jgi:hypothetical protein
VTKETDSAQQIACMTGSLANPTSAALILLPQMVRPWPAALGVVRGNPVCKHSVRARGVVLILSAGEGQAGAGGVHGLAVMASRRMVMTSWPCLRAVSI